MAESVLGVAITWTRQNGGRPAISAFCAGCSVEASGGRNAPAATVAAETTFAPGKVSDASFAHVSSPAEVCCDHATEKESRKTAEIAKCLNT
jgi:phosphotransferase system  glucose/maltose/N-acetylglucosamine-specific IIC component